MNNNVPNPPPIKKYHLNQIAPSFPQESLWFLQQLDPDSFAYNSSFLYELSGKVDPLILERSLNEIIRRHESLRTIFPNRSGKPVQVVQPFKPFSLDFIDYSGLPYEDQQKEISRFISKQGDQPFLLHKGPLVRFSLLHCADDVNYLFFGIHHINSDAWSREIFIKELLHIYDDYRSGKESSLLELPIQYSDYAIWQREWLSGEILSAYVEHWKENLSGVLPILDLATERPRPSIQTFLGQRYDFLIPQDLAAGIREFCQKEKATPFHLFLAAYAILLMRYSGQEDIIIGCPFANRPKQELDGLIGMFVNTLPIRLNLQGDPIFRDFLGNVRSVMMDAFIWQAAPFEAIVSEISPQRDLSRTPVFQVAINMRNIPKDRTSIDGLEIHLAPKDKVTAPFDLSLDFDPEGQTWLASFVFNTDLFNEDFIIRLVAHFMNILTEVLRKSDQRISEIQMLSPSEWNRIVREMNNTVRDFPQVCVHELISDKASENPLSTAVLYKDVRLSYADLEKKANQFAYFLRGNGVGAESRVGVYLRRSEKTIITVLGILKSGGAYVPLDLTYPKDRIAYMVENADPVLIVTSSDLLSELPGHIKTLCIDRDFNPIASSAVDVPSPVADNNSLAYIMYTSGSTGRPKGSMNLHKGVVNYLVNAIRQYHLSPSDRAIQQSSLSFDASVLEIFGTLACGGTIILLDDNQMRDPNSIYSAIIENQATFTTMVPTMLRALCQSARSGENGHNNLKLLFPGGEALLDSDVRAVREVFGHSVKLVNQYGPTETTVSPTNYLVPEELPDNSLVLPIGRPISNIQTYVLDRYFHPVPLGVKGELYISGVGVGRGYWNQPELTRERFLPDLFHRGNVMYRTGDIVYQRPDGTLIFEGREDDQVKIRGYRVELGEIEAVIREFPNIKDSAVVLHRQNGSEILAAYITASIGNQETINRELRAFLTTRLPFYMLPSVIIVLDEMPLTPSLKIDRSALHWSQNDLKGDSYLAPRNEIEVRLVSIWKEVLGVERVGVRDNFFELGGHSLMAVRMFTRIEEEFGQSLPLMTLFKQGTIEALADIIAGGKVNMLADGIMSIQPEGTSTPLYILSAGLYMRPLAMALDHTRPVYSLFPSIDGHTIYRGSVQETAGILLQCLTNFQAEGPYLLLGHSAHGLYAIELARQLREKGGRVAFLCLLDTYFPGSRKQVKFLDRLKIHLANIQGKNIPETIDYFINAAGRIITRSRIAKKYGDLKSEGEVKEKNMREGLAYQYRPELYDGDVYLFSASQRPWFIRWNPMEKWSSIFTGFFENVIVQGDHMSMLKPPNVDELAGMINERLSHIEDE